MVWSNRPNSNYPEARDGPIILIRCSWPFFFWYGAKEPHRKYEQDSWKHQNKKLKDVKVPEFFPDHEIIRGDLLDYAVEIEWFDFKSNQKLIIDHVNKKMDFSL